MGRCHLLTGPAPFRPRPVAWDSGLWEKQGTTMRPLLAGEPVMGGNTAAVALERAISQSPAATWLMGLAVTPAPDPVVLPPAIPC